MEMRDMDIRGVAVIGLGTMGSGIAEVFARAGLPVTAIEADPGALARGMTALGESLSRAEARGKITTAEKNGILARVTPAGSVADAAGAGLVVEVVPERMDIKRQVFAELEEACRPDAILATNTSSLPVTEIAAATRRPGRVVGMHFFNPAPVMRLVEVVSTVLTDPMVTATVTSLAGRLGKTPVAVGDRAGFVANALLLPYLNQAAGLLGAGYATREDIDTAMREGAGLPMGPLTLLDLIGTDTSLSILEVLQAEFGGPRFTPAPVLRRLVSAGLTGRKGGRGFYEYPRPGGTPPPSGSVIPGGSAVPVPPVTVIDPGDGDSDGSGAGELVAALIEAAGVPVTLAGPGDLAGGAPDPGALAVVAAAPGGSVLRSALAARCSGRAVGFHLAGGTLAELVSTVATTPEATAQAMALAARLGVSVVRCPDRPGFLTAALLYPHLNDAVRMVQDGYATAEDADAAMELGCGYPAGPLRMLDEIGARHVHDVLAAMYARSADSAFAPVPLLADHAAAGLSFRR